MKVWVAAVALIGVMVVASPPAVSQDAAPADASPFDASTGPDAALPALDDGDGCSVADQGGGIGLAVAIAALLWRRRATAR